MADEVDRLSSFRLYVTLVSISVFFVVLSVRSSESSHHRRHLSFFYLYQHHHLGVAWRFTLLYGYWTELGDIYRMRDWESDIASREIGTGFLYNVVPDGCFLASHRIRNTHIYHELRVGIAHHHELAGWMDTRKRQAFFSLFVGVHSLTRSLGLGHAYIYVRLKGSVA